MNQPAPSDVFCVPNSEAAALIESLVREGVTVRIRVTGRSMEPAIRNGDVLVIGPAASPLRWGDVALCRRADGSGACFVHRIVWWRGGHVRTKGDALRSVDPPVRADEVIGVVQSVERGNDDAKVIVFRRESVTGRFCRMWRAFLSLTGVVCRMLLRAH